MSAADTRLGRLIQFDERSRGFPIRALLEPKPPRSYTWAIGPRWGLPHLLNQGSTPACTGFSVAHEAAARPWPVQGVTTSIAHSVYRRAQELDPWPGEDYEGSSVLAAIKAGKERGWYGEYRWAFSLEDALLALGYKGPGVIGVPWYEGMMETDSRGFIHPEGQILGGHAILVNGIYVPGQSVRLTNSWGESWGVNGVCRLSFADFERLLAEKGEFVIPIQRYL